MTITTYDTGTIRGALPVTLVYARADLASSQTGIADETETAVALDTEVYDTDGNIWTGGPGMTLTTAGLWLVHASVQFSGDWSGGELGQILLTGAASSHTRVIMASGLSEQYTLHVSELVYTTAANQAIGLSVNVNVATGTVTVTAGNGTYLEAALLATP
jgi:hypothetical protein